MVRNNPRRPEGPETYRVSLSDMVKDLVQRNQCEAGDLRKKRRMSTEENM